MKRKSEVNGKYTIREDQWIVSVLNSGDTRFHLGHSLIVVEGFSEEGSFVGQYDIRVKNISGEIVVSAIKCYESTKSQYTQPYSTLPSSSWHADPENVCKMIDSIKEDKEKAEKAEKIDDYRKYSFVGTNHFLFSFFQERNMNCTDWCIEKIQIAVPSMQYSGTAKPKLLAGLKTGQDQEFIEEVTSTMPNGCNIL
ncbi:MAG: hypothetical protein H0T84_11770 [Tatlockia sp.]|nr:hypothetical protein [Tatlockia sp.]